MTTGIKQHEKNEFYIQAIRGGYYKVMDNYDKSMASLEYGKEAAEKCAKELNELRNNRLTLK